MSQDAYLFNRTLRSLPIFQKEEVLPLPTSPSSVSNTVNRFITQHYAWLTIGITSLQPNVMWCSMDSGASRVPHGTRPKSLPLSSHSWLSGNTPLVAATNGPVNPHMAWVPMPQPALPRWCLHSSIDSRRSGSWRYLHFVLLEDPCAREQSFHAPGVCLPDIVTPITSTGNRIW